MNFLVVCLTPDNEHECSETDFAPLDAHLQEAGPSRGLNPNLPLAALWEYIYFHITVSLFGRTKGVCLGSCFANQDLASITFHFLVLLTHTALLDPRPNLRLPT